MCEEYDPQRAKEIDNAVKEVSALCPEMLARHKIALQPEEYNRLRFHPQWSETGVTVVVKLAASDDPWETRQLELYKCVVRGVCEQSATMRA